MIKSRSLHAVLGAALFWPGLTAFADTPVAQTQPVQTQPTLVPPVTDPTPVTNVPTITDTTPMPEMPSAVAPIDSLTLPQAVDAGMRNSPLSASARYSVISAHENLNSQRAPINPTITYSGVNNTVAPVDLTNPANYAAYITLETNGAQHWRTAQASALFHQAQADADTTRLTLKQSIVNAFVGLQVANKALEIEREAYATAHDLSNLTAKRAQLGASPEDDAIRTQIALVQEKQNLLTAAIAVRTARANLNTVLGRPVSAPVDANPPLDYIPMTIPDARALSEAAAQNRPEVRSADYLRQSLSAGARLERSAYYPNVVLGRGFQGSSQVQLGIVLPLDLGSIRGSVRKAEADAQVQVAQAEVARENVALDVQSSYLGLVSAQQQVESYRSGVLPESASLLSRVKQGYTLGASTILDLIDAQNTYRTTMNSYYAAVGNYEQAVYLLEHAIGAPLGAPNGAPSNMPVNAPSTTPPNASSNTLPGTPPSAPSLSTPVPAAGAVGRVSPGTAQP